MSIERLSIFIPFYWLKYRGPLHSHRVSQDTYSVMAPITIFSSTIRSIMRAITVILSSALQILVKVFDQPRFKPYNSTLDAYITLKLYHNHSTLLVNKET